MKEIKDKEKKQTVLLFLLWWVIIPTIIILIGGKIGAWMALLYWIFKLVILMFGKK